MHDQPDYAHPLTDADSRSRDLPTPVEIVHELETLIYRISSAFQTDDGEELVAISDEFMGYADDLAEHGHRLGAPRSHRLYLCAVCHVNPVDADAGFDTCASCLARQ